MLNLGDLTALNLKDRADLIGKLLGNCIITGLVGGVECLINSLGYLGGIEVYFSSVSLFNTDNCHFIASCNKDC